MSEEELEFEINKNTWSIELVDKEFLLNLYKEIYGEEALFAYGVCMPPRLKIYINKDMEKQQQIKTLKHELTHCYIWNYGLYNVPQFNEEMCCDLVSSINDFINEVVQKFKDNDKRGN